jgi:hypothetical protein
MKLKNWIELDAEQRELVGRLPASAQYSIEERKQHIFCPRCWYEFSSSQLNAA